MSLKKEFNEKGPFKTTQDGSVLTKEAYAKIQAIMQKHVWIKFHIAKRELVEKRFNLYQDRHLKEYDKTISTQVSKFIRESDSIEEKALIFL